MAGAKVGETVRPRRRKARDYPIRGTPKSTERKGKPFLRLHGGFDRAMIRAIVKGIRARQAA